MSQFLATVDSEVPISLTLNGMKLGRPDPQLPSFKARYGLN